MSRIFWCLFFTIWPIVALVACAISPQMNWGFPENLEAATPLGRRIDDLFYLILWIVVIAFIATMLALSYVLWKASKNEDEKGWFSHGSHNLEMIWTIVPSGILLFIALYQMDVWALYRVRDYDLQPGQSREQTVVAEVTARQFEWRIRYPGPDRTFKDQQAVKDWLARPHKGDLYAVNHLRVPLNRETVIYLKSADVQHAFFVPDLRVKQDALPGQAIDVWFTVNRAGDFDLTCAELCGWGHYKMRGRVTAIDDFTGFLRKLKAEQEYDGVTAPEAEVAGTSKSRGTAR